MSAEEFPETLPFGWELPAADGQAEESAKEANRSEAEEFPETRPPGWELPAADGEAEKPAEDANRAEAGPDNASEVTISSDSENGDDDDSLEGYTPTCDKRLPRRVFRKDPKDPARKFRCPLVGCAYVGKYLSSLKYHKKTHDLTPLYQCVWQRCNRLFSTKALLDQHTRIHDKVSYQCSWPDCHREYSNKYLLKNHTSIHTGENLYLCTWSNCGGKFISKQNLEQHTRIHTGERPYQCKWPLCNASFVQETHLRNHTMRHTGEKNFRCDFPSCNWAFRQKASLLNHKRAIHEDIKPHVCERPECGKRYLLRCQLRHHLMVHDGIKPYACDWPDCSYRAVSKSEVRCHRKTHSSKENPESIHKKARKKSAKSNNVDQHQRSHSEMIVDNIQADLSVSENKNVPEDNPRISNEEEFFDCDLPEPDKQDHSEDENKIIIQHSDDSIIYNEELVQDMDDKEHISAHDQ